MNTLGQRDKIARIIEKQVQNWGSTIQYLKFDPNNERNTYDEFLGTKYLPPVELQVVFKDSPSKDELEEFGMDLDTMVLIRIPQIQLDVHNLKPEVNDKIILNDEDYLVYQVANKGNIRNKPIFVVVGCRKGAYINGK